MIVIRLIRRGKKNQPFFRIVVTDKRNSPKGGRFLEILGFFNPLTKEKGFKKERIKYWISVGAQTSDRVHNLLVSEKIIEGKKIAVHKKAKKKKAEKEPKEEKKEKKEEKVKEVPKKEEPKEEVKEEVKKEVKEPEKKEEKVEEKPKEKKEKGEEEPKKKEAKEEKEENIK